MTRQIIKEGKDEIKGYEALRLFAYPDPASPLARLARGYRWGFQPATAIIADLAPSVAGMSGAPWTCGWGHPGSDVGPDTSCTEAQAEQWLDDDLRGAEDTVERLVHVRLTDHQFAALVSFVYNLGEGNFAKSTLLQKLNEGAYDEVPRQLAKWNHALQDGKPVEMPGLTARRAHEAAMWMESEEVASAAVVVAPAPAVAAHKDPTLVGAGITVGGSSIAGLIQWVKSFDFSTAHTAVQAASDQLKPLVDMSTVLKTMFIGFSVIGVGLIVVARFKERKNQSGVS